ncbi:hypothetical protein A5893_17180 [Pedobacter psychrophilus]|uniref:Uncharacterized protein n=1 Tax=Pedobacter psychrophilus TaxID=1826909 RepID=A0A179DSW1_9SPHI|nr:hypothetical protein [Pedobacter psychrophilus]OAQ43519.1 hypothetical protein A5893_17180 [Pedobacter psychrophilus]
MIDNEHGKNNDNLKIAKSKIRGCFGSEDGEFAGHPADESRAKELRKLAVLNHISLTEMEDIALEYLHEKKYTEKHITEQMKDITKFFKEKLK